MLKKIDIATCHTLLLQIAEAFDAICRRHQLPYYMLGGTMLGAIRHGGFIPWDDDMDFGIPRPFFDTFIQIAKKELPETMEVVGRRESPVAKKGFVKIQIKGSKVLERVFDIEEKSAYNGISIDVFPLDGADRHSFMGRFRIKTAFFLERFHEAQFCSLAIRKGKKKWVAAFIKALPIREKDVAAFIDRWIQQEAYQNCQEIANYYGHWKEREVIDRTIFGEPVSYSFAHLQLLGPSNADAYLTALYHNYMELPPKEQQLTHADEIYIEVPEK